MASLLIAANSYTTNTADNTSLRALGTAISNAFANAGWVQTADAGQITWANVVANGSATINFGYEMWRMNDALQNTAPVFLKIEYASISTNTPVWFFTVGTKTDGNGTITGLFTARSQIRGPAENSTTPFPWFFCGNPNRIAIAGSNLITGSNTSPVFMAVERTHDNTGADTDEGVLVTTISGGVTQTYQVYLNLKTGVGPAETTIGVFLPSVSVGGVGSAFLWYPLYFNTGGGYTNPILCGACGYINQFPVNVPVTLTHYGQQHTYLPTYVGSMTLRSSGTASNFRMLILWE